MMSLGGVIHRTRTLILERQTMSGIPSTESGRIIEKQTTISPLYKVLLHNDDRNTMEHVVMVLIQVFRFPKPVCERIMMEAHHNGIALCAIEPFERAELHKDQLHSYSLIATIERY